MTDADTSLLFQQFEKSPRLLLQRELLKQHNASLKLARADRMSDMEVAAGVKREGETEETMAVLGLSIGLPVFNRNQGGIREAELNRQALQLESDAAASRLRAELYGLVRQYQTNRNEMEMIQNRSLPDMSKAFEQTQMMYSRGKAGFLDLLDMQKTLLESRASWIEAAAQMKIAMFRIQSLLGTGYDGTDKKDDL
jgi:cobalt-zinc-cadmium efflux system outer membrane protein